MSQIQLSEHNPLCVQTQDSQDLTSESFAPPLATAYKIYQTHQPRVPVLTVFYISDIHILHHLNPNTDAFRQIRSIAQGLYQQIKAEISTRRHYEYVILFAGDVSSSSLVTKQFYHQFALLFHYEQYKEWQAEYRGHTPLSKKSAQLLLEQQIDRLIKEREQYLSRFRKWRKYTARHESMDEDSILARMKKEEGLPAYLPNLLHSIKRLEFEINYARRSYESNLEKMTTAEVFTKKSLPIFTVLGNHELNEYKTVEEAVVDYSEFFRKERICFLHNSAVTYRSTTFLGGIGFAKYNNQYNATNVCTTTPPMTREEEIRQTNHFIDVYNRVLEKCIEEQKQLIVLTHYPTYSWLPESKHNSRCVYFYGHDHRNHEVHEGCTTIYASNQIGYDTKDISFSTCHLGIIHNPFIEYEDGWHQITVEDYSEFYRFNNSYIQTKGIQKRLQNSDLYMIKSDGFYGFFLQDSKGVSICQGGVVKRLYNISSIHHCFTYFKLMVNAYIGKLWPYRNAQNQISKELQMLGLSGKIHGCIVDIDFQNHIMINPMTGETACYNSPIMGYVKTYATFDELVSLYLSEKSYFDDTSKKKLLLAWETLRSQNSILPNIGRAALPAPTSRLTYEYVGYGGLYTVSRKMNSLQRLFDMNVLREWDELVIEEELKKNAIE